MGYERGQSHEEDYGDRRRRPREAILPNRQAPLREQVREVMRFLRYSPRTEETYWQWIVRFLRHHRVPGKPGREGWRQDWDGKGAKDRVTMVPETLLDALAEQIGRVEVRHEQDRPDGYRRVWLPDALPRKYSSAPRELAWQWVFPAQSLCSVPNAPTSNARSISRFPRRMPGPDTWPGS